MCLIFPYLQADIIIVQKKLDALVFYKNCSKCSGMISMRSSYKT